MQLLKFLKISGTDKSLVNVSADAPLPIGFTPDVTMGKLTSASITTPAAANGIRRVEVPTWARGVKMYANANNSRFGLGTSATSNAPEAVDTLTAIAANTTDVLTSAFVDGGFLKKDSWEVRLLATGTVRWLYLQGITASTVIDVEFFA